MSFDNKMIIDAIARSDTSQAQKLMLAHLGHIESSLNFDSPNQEADLESIFSNGDTCRPTLHIPRR